MVKVKKLTKVLRVLIIIFLAIILYTLLTKTRGGKELLVVVQKINPANLQVAPPTLAPESVIGQINEYRKTSKFVELKRNDKLDKAAAARLSVIEEKQDFNGQLTGVGLENSVKNSEYLYSVVGELDGMNVIQGMDLVKNWISDASSLKLLQEKSLTDIGIAIKARGSMFDLVVIMAKPANPTIAPKQKQISWGGIELWNAINKRRVEMGVGQLSRREELCTIASIRLNQLLELGKLDGHAGLEPTLSRPDLKWIRDKYTIAEFLVYGYQTPASSVAAWENTLGHRELLSGGQYVWGCAYAQDTFGVAIAAF